LWFIRALISGWWSDPVCRSGHELATRSTAGQAIRGIADHYKASSTTSRQSPGSTICAACCVTRGKRHGHVFPDAPTGYYRYCINFAAAPLDTATAS